MKEFLDFFQTIGERLRSRVFGPFIISLLVWNWKPLLMLIASKNPIEVTIKMIETDGMFSFFNVFLIPLGISLSYSILVPFLSLGLGWLVIWPQGKSIQSNYILKGKRRKEDVKIAKLDYEYENAKAGKLELEDLNNKIDNLQKSNEKYIKDNEEMRSRISSILSFESDFKNLEEENSRLKKSLKEVSEMAFKIDGEHLQSSLDLVNSELQKGNFALDGIPQSFIQHLVDHNMLKYEEINGKKFLNFTNEGRKTQLSKAEMENEK